MNPEYAKGYRAGLRRKRKAISDEQQAAKEKAFWQRAFVAVLPEAMTAEGWKRAEKPIFGVEDRVNLAADFATSALMHARRFGRL